MNVLFALKPANALPLLFAADVTAWRASDMPCAPVLHSEGVERTPQFRQDYFSA
jgi:hypothetical protein